VQDKAEERAQLANVNYIAARHWEALVESRKLCAQVSYQTGSRLVAPGLLASIAVLWLQVSTHHAELQSELRRSAAKIRVLEKVTSPWTVPNITEQLKQAVSACARPLLQ